MTPDELRRMDNDLCIIYEKGIKPVKAEKYYYFKQDKLYKELQKDTLDHNHFDAGTRGTWRKYNPYNPYVPEDDKKKQVENLKVESLDDLFDEEIENKKPEVEEVNFNKEDTNLGIESLEDLFEAEILDNKEIKEPQNINDDLFGFEEFETPEVPKEPISEDAFTEDLQKELEAKFDELFGPIE